MAARRIIHYDQRLKALSRELRTHSTLSEVLLWNHLKSRQMRGYRFLRQKPVDHFIVDFFCYELMLAIEIDGQTHDHKILQDVERQKRIESLGIKVLRFLDTDVKRNVEGVMRTIELWIEAFEEGRRELKNTAPPPQCS